MDEEIIEPFVWSNQAPHPLQNPLILTYLFKLCPPELLPKIRLVCRQWRDLSLPMCRSSLPIIVSKFGSDIILGSISHRVYPELFYHFKDFVRDRVDNPQIKSDKFPYRCIKLLRWYYDSILYFRRPEWDAVRNIVTTLEVDDCSVPEVEEFRKLIYQTFPNLKILRLLNCQFSDNVRHSENLIYIEPAYGEHHQLKSLTVTIPNFTGRNRLPVSWMELFTHFPSLAHFSFEVSSSTILYGSDRDLEEKKMEECNQLFKSIEILRNHDGHNLPFKTFNLPPVLDIIPTREKVDLLQKSNLPMEQVVMRLHVASDMEGELVDDTAHLFAKPLRKLLMVPMNDSLTRVDWRLGMNMNNLRSLHLSDVICESMNFLEWTPYLEELRFSNSRTYPYIDHPNYHSATLMVSNSRLPDNVKLLKLSFFTCLYLLTANDVSKLVQWMPSIEKLTMFLDDSQFETVCNYWKGLTHLIVLGNKLTNAGLTGRYGQNGDTPRPNITYLQKLESFTSFKITVDDVSVYHGFLHLPLLQHLGICEPPTLSKEARKELLRRKGIRLMGWEGDIE